MRCLSRKRPLITDKQTNRQTDKFCGLVIAMWCHVMDKPKIKVVGQTDQLWEGRQTDGRTDGRYQVHYLPTSRLIMILVDIGWMYMSEQFEGNFCTLPEVLLRPTIQRVVMKTLNNPSRCLIFYIHVFLILIAIWFVIRWTVCCLRLLDIHHSKSDPPWHVLLNPFMPAGTYVETR